MPALSGMSISMRQESNLASFSFDSINQAAAKMQSL